MGGDPAGTADPSCPKRYSSPYHIMLSNTAWGGGERFASSASFLGLAEFSRLAVDEQLWDFCIICGGFVLIFFEKFCFSFYTTLFSLLSYFVNP